MYFPHGALRPEQPLVGPDRHLPDPVGSPFFRAGYGFAEPLGEGSGDSLQPGVHELIVTSHGARVWRRRGEKGVVRLTGAPVDTPRVSV